MNRESVTWFREWLTLVVNDVVVDCNGALALDRATSRFDSATLRFAKAHSCFESAPLAPKIMLRPSRLAPSRSSGRRWSFQSVVSSSNRRSRERRASFAKPSDGFAVLRATFGAAVALLVSRKALPASRPPRAICVSRAEGWRRQVKNARIFWMRRRMSSGTLHTRSRRVSCASARMSPSSTSPSS